MVARSDSLRFMTISDRYRAEQQSLHKNEKYGRASVRYAPLVRALLRTARCSSLSDYGAGKCKLQWALGDHLNGIDYRPYDPAFAQYGPPRAADLVVCIDVLEHIEPDMLDATLDEIASLTDRFALLTIHTGPAVKFLSDGRNAHLTQQPSSWWVPRLEARFDVLHLQHVKKGFLAITCRRGMSDEVQFYARSRDLARVAARWEPRRLTTRLKFKLASAQRKMELAARDWLARRP